MTSTLQICQLVISALSILLGPVIAVQITLWYNRRKEAFARKDELFKTLMSTRHYYNTLQAHVDALNKIDIEFGRDKKARSIIAAWRLYLDALNSPMVDNVSWNMRREDRMISLLDEMGKFLGYDFDLAHLKSAFYCPVAHGDQERDWLTVRRGLVEMVKGDRPVYIAPLPSAQNGSGNLTEGTAPTEFATDNRLNI